MIYFFDGNGFVGQNLAEWMSGWMDGLGCTIFALSLSTLE